MIHLLLFMGTFYSAIEFTRHIQTHHMHPANYLLIGGLGILLFIIAIDFATERLQQRRRMNPRRRFSRLK